MRIEGEYFNEVDRVANAMRLYLEYYIMYSNLSDLFESTKEDYKRKIMQSIELKFEQIAVSNKLFDITREMIIKCIQCYVFIGRSTKFQ